MVPKSSAVSVFLPSLVVLPSGWPHRRPRGQRSTSHLRNGKREKHQESRKEKKRENARKTEKKKKEKTAKKKKEKTAKKKCRKHTKKNQKKKLWSEPQVLESVEERIRTSKDSFDLKQEGLFGGKASKASYAFLETRWNTLTYGAWSWTFGLLLGGLDGRWPEATNLMCSDMAQDAFQIAEDDCGAKWSQHLCRKSAKFIHIILLSSFKKMGARWVGGFSTRGSEDAKFGWDKHRTLKSTHQTPKVCSKKRVG